MEEVPELDLGLRGEGELIFANLFKPDLDKTRVPGILWRNNRKIVENPMKAKISMDDLPAMDVESFSPLAYTGKNSYIAAMGIERKRGLKCSIKR